MVPNSLEVISMTRSPPLVPTQALEEEATLSPGLIWGQGYSLVLQQEHGPAWEFTSQPCYLAAVRSSFLACKTGIGVSTSAKIIKEHL